MKPCAGGGHLTFSQSSTHGRLPPTSALTLLLTNLYMFENSSTHDYKGNHVQVIWWASISRHVKSCQEFRGQKTINASLHRHRRLQSDRLPESDSSETPRCSQIDSHGPAFCLAERCGHGSSGDIKGRQAARASDTFESTWLETTSTETRSKTMSTFRKRGQGVNPAKCGTMCRSHSENSLANKLDIISPFEHAAMWSCLLL